MLVDELLGRFGAAYAEAKAARAGVDFDDLELRVRDLLAGDDALRARWAERFALIMVDEFQDTNRLQLDVLEALERGNLFAVGDEAQSIYGFRHADVGIFRARRAALGAGGVRGLTVNFRSRPEILDVVNAAFAPLLGPGFTPLVAGRGPDELRLFAPDPPEEPRVELLACETSGWDEREAGLGLAGLAAQPWRRAEARAVAARLRAEVDDSGRAVRDLVVLVRATSSLRLYEQALEEQGLPTYVVGGRGYWSQEQVRDGIAYLSLLANPHDEAALYATLSSPFCGAGTDALVLLAEAGRSEGEGAWAALRRAARARSGRGLVARRASPRIRPPGSSRSRASPPASGCGPSGSPSRCCSSARSPRPATTSRSSRASGGDRRLANLRKLMRLARDYERAEGRDLRGFLAYAVGQDLAEAREGEAALESEGLDAVRLMTIHRAKGLEFPVVCVADLGRPGVTARERLLVGQDGTAGLKLATLAGGDPVAALGHDRIAERARGGRGGRGAQAALRRRHARRGAADPGGRRRHREVARAAPGRPADRLARTRAARRPGRRAGRGAGRRRVRRRRRLRPAGHGGQPARRGRRAGRRASAAPGPARRCPPSRR